MCKRIAQLFLTGLKSTPVYFLIEVMGLTSGKRPRKPKSMGIPSRRISIENFNTLSKVNVPEDFTTEEYNELYEWLDIKGYAEYFEEYDGSPSFEHDEPVIKYGRSEMLVSAKQMKKAISEIPWGAKVNIIVNSPGHRNPPPPKFPKDRRIVF